MLARLASLSYRRRWIVLVVWIVVLVGITFTANRLGREFSQTFRLPESDSQVATDLLKARFPSQGSLVSSDIVYKADAGVNDPAVRQRMTELFDQIKAVPGVADVASPYGGPRAAFQVSKDGTIAYATVQFSSSTSGGVPASSVTAIRDDIDRARTEGLQIETGGSILAGQQRPGSTEGIGLLAAVIILLIAFGSVLAMGLPIATALFGIGVGFGVVGLLTHVTSVPEFSTQLAAMIGIGVGIDYALFIVTRYRQGLAEGFDPHQATVVAIDTAGRAVLFAGTTVVISLLGMLLIGIEFISGLGLAAASVVLVTMVASLTLLPALLGFVGHNIDRLKIPGVTGGVGTDRHGFWFRWSRTLQHHPWPAALGGLALLLVLSIPVLGMRLGSSDASNQPTSSTTRRAYDLKTELQGVGANGPLLLVAELPAGSTAESLAPVATAVQQTPGVTLVVPPRLNQAGDAAQLIVIPTTSPQDAATTDLIERLRADVLPAATAGSGITVHVGGLTATFDDLAVQLQQRLPVFIGVVLGLSFVLLLAVFRSILVPLKAVIMNLLSIGAAYGIVVAVFQHGWGASVLAVGNPGPIESFLPMMMFAILFGLSMDYEVFLLSRIKEEYDRTGDNSLAVADGLSATARVITAAALIMVTVFGGFVFGDQRVVKEFGLGMAAAILIDATVVRMVLVPATMELMGKANWWFPSWLSWLPQIHVEGTRVPLGDAASGIGVAEPATEPGAGPTDEPTDELEGVSG